MTHPILYSAPDEQYIEHINKCQKKFEMIFPVFESTIRRIFSMQNGEIRQILNDMILFHDLGKLTKRWQGNLDQNKKLPSHAPIGAAYLYKKFTTEDIQDDLKNAIVFAVAIHHTDSGLLGDNIERPDVQAIIDGIVDNDGKIIWVSERETLSEEFFPKELNELTIEDFKNMARGLRIWAKGCELLKQHQRRLQALLAHNILKLCDITAATERKEYQNKDEQNYYGGWLMVEDIKNYVDAISERTKP